jgi:hypothetical protein
MEPGQKEEAPQARSKYVLQNKHHRHDPQSAPQTMKIAHPDKQEKTKT